MSEQLDTKKYKNKIAFMLRDAAIEIENKDLSKAISYMREANTLKPDGPFIVKKLKDYNNTYNNYKTEIKKVIEKGNITKASEMLGYLTQNHYQKKILLSRFCIEAKEFVVAKDIIEAISEHNYSTNFLWNMSTRGILNSSLPTESEIMSNWLHQGAPVISIVSITYNHAKYVTDAISSFLQQKTSVPFEIIVHDDVSNDGTQEILKAFQDKYPNIIRLILQKENQYSQGNKPRHIATRTAKGDFLCFCEGDDFWISPHKVEQQYQALKNNPTAFSCIHGFHGINEINYSSKERFDADGMPTGIELITSDDLSRGNAELLRLNTLMHRRPQSFDYIFPHEIKNVAVGDQFNSSIMGFQGDTIKLLGFKASAYRFSGEGTWSSQSKEMQFIYMFSLHGWMAIYFKRLGNDEFYQFYLEKVKAKKRVFDALNINSDTHYLKQAKAVYQLLFND